MKIGFVAASNRRWSADCFNSKAITDGIRNDGQSPLPAPWMEKSPVIQASGAATLADLLLVEQTGRGLADATVASAPDLSGGKGPLP